MTMTRAQMRQDPVVMLFVAGVVAFSAVHTIATIFFPDPYHPAVHICPADGDCYATFP